MSNFSFYYFSKPLITFQIEKAIISKVKNGLFNLPVVPFKICDQAGDRNV